MQILGLGTLESEIILGVLIVLVAVAIGKAVNYFFDRFIKRMAAKTESKADDEFMDKIHWPVMIFAVLIGIDFGIKQISSISAYVPIISLILNIIYIIIGAKIIEAALKLVMTLYMERIAPMTDSEVDDQIMPVISVVTKIAVYGVSAVLIINALGYDIGPMLAGMGIGGLAIALALQDTLKGFFAGLYLIADKPLKKGEYVKLETGEDGVVEEVGWRSTRIRALKNYLIIIPNTKLSSIIITNYDTPPRPHNFLLTIGVDYDSPVDKVEKIITQEAKKIQKNHPNAAKNFDPIVRFNDFSDFSLDYLIIFRAKGFRDKWEMGANFKKALFKRFKKEKISVPFPTQTIELKK